MDVPVGHPQPTTAAPSRTVTKVEDTHPRPIIVRVKRKRYEEPLESLVVQESENAKKRARPAQKPLGGPKYEFSPAPAGKNVVFVRIEAPLSSGELSADKIGSQVTRWHRKHRESLRSRSGPKNKGLANRSASAEPRVQDIKQECRRRRLRQVTAHRDSVRKPGRGVTGGETTFVPAGVAIPPPPPSQKGAKDILKSLFNVIDLESLEETQHAASAKPVTPQSHSTIDLTAEEQAIVETYMPMYEKVGLPMPASEGMGAYKGKESFSGKTPSGDACSHSESSEDTEYVYDLYLMDETRDEVGAASAVVQIDSWACDLYLEEELEGLTDDDSEDSNAEGYYQNEYPDEDSANDDYDEVAFYANRNANTSSSGDSEDGAYRNYYGSDHDDDYDEYAQDEDDHGLRGQVSAMGL